MNVQLKSLLSEIVPRFSLCKHKGQDGRLCVIGGSLEYTGAPYFAAIATLKSGADLCSIVCEKSAAIPIKCYSPELIVEPLMNIEIIHDDTIFNKWLNSTFKRFSAIICGPGLSRHPQLLNYAQKVIQSSIDLNMPLVLDGDALYLLATKNARNLLFAKNSNNLSLETLSNVILTPNAMEFRRLWINCILCKDIENYSKSDEDEYLPPFNTNDLSDHFCNKLNENESKENVVTALKTDVILSCEDYAYIDHIRDTAKLAKILGYSTILRKGNIDIICDGHWFLLVQEPVSGRRCGGQGDILAGFCGLWMSWMNISQNANISQKYESLLDRRPRLNCNLIAAYAASYLMRNVAYAAFQKYRRSTLTTNMLEFIPEVMEREFPTEEYVQSSL